MLSPPQTAEFKICREKPLFSHLEGAGTVSGRRRVHRTPSPPGKAALSRGEAWQARPSCPGSTDQGRQSCQAGDGVSSPLPAPLTCPVTASSTLPGHATFSIAESEPAQGYREGVVRTLRGGREPLHPQSHLRSSYHPPPSLNLCGTLDMCLPSLSPLASLEMANSSKTCQPLTGPSPPSHISQNCTATPPWLAGSWVDRISAKLWLFLLLGSQNTPPNIDSHQI